jgi:indolepyruvate ferredoxin oxidoreductase
LLAECRLPAELHSLASRRVAQVIDYQSPVLARTFLELVERVARHDGANDRWDLTRAVIESWYRLLTYKDEYEVARLHAATHYDAMARSLGIEGPYELKYHLHPPVLRRLGLRHKLPLGRVYAFTFALLRRLKWLRGTPFDIFGWDRDRRLERELIAEYRQLTGELLANESMPYANKVELAASAIQIKGYGPVKERSVEAWHTRVAELTRAAAVQDHRAAE